MGCLRLSASDRCVLCLGSPTLPGLHPVPIPRLGELSTFPLFHELRSESMQQGAGNRFSPRLQVLRHWLELSLQAQK